MARKPKAFDTFVNTYHSKLFQYSYLMCGQREDAEEISQETLLQVFKSLDQLRDPAHLKPWVFRIAKNACYMKRRKSIFPRSANILRGFACATEERIEIADWSHLPEDQVLRSELSETLEQAITELPEIYRSVLLLRDVEGLRSDETADVLEISVDTVKQRLHRARMAVRAKLDEYLRHVERSEDETRINA